MEFEQLRQLDAIARTGSFSAAAAELHTSQPAVSRSMRALEHELGCELFSRFAQQSRAQRGGHARGAPRARHPRRGATHARRLCRARPYQPHPHRGLVSHRRPCGRLTERVVALLPGTVLTSEVEQHEEEVERRLLDRSADLVITRRPITLPTVRCVPFMTESLSVYAPRTSPLAGRHSVSFSELDGSTFLMNAAVGFWGEVVRAAMPNARFIEQRDGRVLGDLVRTTDILGFVTDITQAERSGGGGRGAREHPHRRRRGTRDLLRGCLE